MNNKFKYATICPHCLYHLTYRNKLEWILLTPFHWFGKRKVTCVQCGEKAYTSIMKVKKSR